MKRHNINAVRTSHYPPDTRLPRPVRRLRPVGDRRVRPGDPRLRRRRAGAAIPSDDPAWREAYLDRAERMVERDKNHPASSSGPSATRPAPARTWPPWPRWIRGRDPSRLIHYEGDYENCAYVDMYSRMYAGYEEVDAIGRRAEPRPPTRADDAHRRAAPVHQCEYGHAMGNGPGGLREYQELYENVPAAGRAGSSGSGSTTASPRPHADGAHVLRLRRRLRRGSARRQLRRRRPDLPRPHPVAGPAGLQEGHRAGPRHPRRAPPARSPSGNLHHTRDTGYLRWTLEPGGRRRSPGRAAIWPSRPSAAGQHGDRRLAAEKLGILLATAPRGERWLTVTAAPRRRRAVGRGGARDRLGPVPRRRPQAPAAPWIRRLRCRGRAMTTIELGSRGIRRAHRRAAPPRRARRGRSAPGPVACADRQRPARTARLTGGRPRGTGPACTGCTTRCSPSNQADRASQVRTRVAAAGTDVAMDAVYQWTADSDLLWLT